MEILALQCAIDEIMYEKFKNPTWTYRQCANELFFNYMPMKIKQVNCQAVCAVCMTHFEMNNKNDWAGLCTCGRFKIPQNFIKVKNEIELHKIRFIKHWAFIDCDYPFHELEPNSPAL
jgi:hypothetical protein